MKPTFKYYFTLVLLLLFSLQSCNTTEPPIIPPPDLRKITITFEDASCTEVWLKIKADSLTLPVDIKLLKDAVTQNIILTTKDTVLYIDSLLPNQTYNYQAVLSTDTTIKSEKVTAQTMDTTSHNFTFQSFTFGTIGSSTLYDVAIINENNIWAVGEIMIADTSINGYTTYNAAHWNGSDWELKQIPYYYNGQTYYPEIRAILAFNENDIWFGVASLMHWNGAIYQSISTASFFPALVNKMWGTSSNNFYIVGTNGQIAFYNGTSWQRIESGTTLNINDIWGDFNEKTQEWEILAVASNIFSGFEKEVIQIKNTSTEIINKDGIDETLSSVWFNPNRKYYVIGSGTYEKTNLYNPIWKGDPLDLTIYFENRVRANKINDVIIVGAYGETLHFNGVTWESFFNQTSLLNGTYLSVGIKNNLIIAVGYKSAQAVLTVGQR